jgi:hypothetical protein
MADAPAVLQRLQELGVLGGPRKTRLDEPPPLDVGCRAVLQGLTTRTDLNGCSFEVVGEALGGRWLVRCDAGGECVRAREANLVVLDGWPEDEIESSDEDSEEEERGVTYEESGGAAGSRVIRALDLSCQDGADDALLLALAGLCALPGTDSAEPGLGHLRELCLDNCERVTDAGIGALGRLRQLEAVSLRATAVSDAGLRAMCDPAQGAWLALGEVCLDGCVRVGDGGVVALAEVSLNLRSIDLSGLVKLTDMGTAAIGRGAPACVRSLWTGAWP